MSIPVNLYPVNRSVRAGLRMIGPSGEPVSREYYVPESGKQVTDDDMVRGYQWKDGRYITVSDEELERLAPEKSRAIDLQRFVKQDAIPPLYFERSYFLAPAEGAAKAYRLLASTMEQEQRAGIATFVMRGKEYPVAIFAENGVLRAETLRFPDEIRSPADIGLPKQEKPKPQIVSKFEKLISTRLADRFKEDDLVDRKTEQTLKLVESKRKKQDNVVHSAPQEETRGKVADLLSVLKQSLEKTGPKSSGTRRRRRAS